MKVVNINDVLKILHKYGEFLFVTDHLRYMEMRNEIANLPNVTPHPKTGLWIRHDTGHSKYYTCSLCDCAAPCTETADNILWKLANYCPDCGAMMVNHNLRLIGGNFESEDEE